MMVVNMELLLNFEATSQEFALGTGNHPRFKSRSAFRVQIPFWPLADVVLGSPEFNFLATLVNSELVCLLPVGILNQGMFIYMYHYLFTLVLKSQLRIQKFTNLQKSLKPSMPTVNSYFMLLIYT